MSIDAGVRIGKYEVGRQLGKGGFGILHVARDHELGRDVAIKFLRPEHAFKPTVVQRFIQEARAAARIHHPGIVTVYESGIVGGTNTRADGTVYIAMELLAGVTLAQRIKQLGRLPTAIAINYARQLASALGAAHDANIIHRDLKPANVFLVPDPAVVGGERVKVLDFGIAKLADDFGGSVQTHSMLMLGTPMYMSPEQCKSSAKVDARSDIYSLGCIVFEMLCGKPPFDGDSGELIAKHQLIQPPTARSLRGELPAALDRLVSSMLAKAPDERPQTMALVEDMLARFDEQQTREPATIEDAPTGLAVPAPRSRVPLLLGGAGAIALGITFGLVSMCGHDSRRTTAQQTTAPADAAAALAVAAPPDAAPAPPDAGVDIAKAGSDIEVECLEHQARHEWAQLATCADRLAAFDPDKAATFKATAQLEATAEAELAAIEDAINKKDKERAKQILAQVDKRSVYRQRAEQEAEQRVDGGKVTPSTSCNAEALKDKGMEAVTIGDHAAALTRFEASLRCKDDGYVRSLAFMAACMSRNASKANQYYGTLTDVERSKFKQMCVRNKVKLSEPTASATCDAGALKDKGMDNVNMGQHAAALDQFEASLRCKSDPYVLSLAFMAACTAQNSAKAMHYYPMLSPAQQQRLSIMCVRNKTAYE